MANLVYFDPIAGGDGSIVSDDDSPTTGLANGGMIIRLVPMFQQVVNIAKKVIDTSSLAAGENSSAVAVGVAVTNALAAANALVLSNEPVAPTIRPSLLLDFANSKSLDPRITFARASTATRVNERGLIEVVSANVPRFDHDPVNLECKGLLIEEQRSNILLNSETLATQSVTTTATPYTLSFYGTGTVVLSGSHSATIVGTGIFPSRKTLTFTPAAGTLTLTVTGSITQAQLEEGSFSTSYIPTTSTSYTRIADSAQITGTNFSSWYRQDEGTVFVKSDALGLYDAATVRITQSISLYADANNYIDIRDYGLSSNITTDVFSLSGGSAQFDFGGTSTSTAGLWNAQCLTYKANDAACSMNGLTIESDVSVTLPVGINMMKIGSGGAKHISKISYFAKRLSNAELQVLSQ
jgi:hypothetical protein